MLRTYVRPQGSGDRTTVGNRVCHDLVMGLTVLIVDDHPSFRASARAMLESEGFDVVGEAEDGTSAVEAVRALAPDVVLLDVQLPDMTGFDVCAAIQSRNGETPEIAASCACGFVPKGELSGELLADLLS
jgi:response regulator RpfG family c-di-GMP phosphodiesterase